MARRNSIKYEQIVAALIERIKSGELPPGTRLSGQFALAAEYGVSAITANRALDELRKRGFIERRERCRSVVCPSPRFVRKMVVIISREYGDPAPWLHLYLDELGRINASNGISTVIMQRSDPELAATIFDFTTSPGVILAGFESPELIEQLEQHRIPHLVLGLRADRCKFNVTEDRILAGSRLAEYIIRREHAANMVFFGDFSKPNHREALEGCRQECLSRENISFTAIDAENLTIGKLREKLREISRETDAILVMGSKLPFKLLPYLRPAHATTALGFFTESPAIMNLQGIAYLASYSQSEVARLAATMIEDIAANRLTAPTTRLASVHIIPPDSG